MPLRSIVAFGPGVWRWPDVGGSTRYHLWTLANMGWRVLYVEPPTTFRWKADIWNAPDRPFSVLRPGRVVPFAVRKVVEARSGEVWRAAAAQALLKQAQGAISHLVMHPTVYWFGAPWHGGIAEKVPADRLRVAHVYDELSDSPALLPMQRDLLWKWEQQLLRQCHVAACSSLPQKQRREGMAGETLLLGNAVRDDFLQPDSIPFPEEGNAALELLQSAPSPRMVYGGVADARLDPQLFAALLEKMEGGSLTFLGHRDPSLDPKFDELAKDPRVRFAGRIPMSAYPTLYRHADVLLIAHRINAFTEGMYPEKLNEYLTSGKPIVSVEMSEVRRIGGELLRLASTPEEFAASALAAAGEDDERRCEERRRIAAEHTWSREGERLNAALLEACAKASISVD